jgi:D-alanyl-D-alanine carboxypeptidase/D-alanyl-D-alanine-endopeptidase (penicillin-binding protein 4)
VSGIRHAGRRALALAALLLGLALAPALAAASSLEALIARHGFSPEAVGVVVEDVATGRRSAAHRAGEPGLPASTLKLVTAWAALETLGPEHRFTTRLWRSGAISDDGVLAGDLVLEGGGDPLMDLDALMALAWALRAAGVERVAGRFILDDSTMPSLPVVNPDQPVEAGYNAGVGALSLAFNRVERRPAADGGMVTLPPLRERGPAWSRLPFDGPASVPVQDAGLHAAWVFHDLAQSLGIVLAAPERTGRPSELVLVADQQSRTLREIVQAMLLYSNNQVAEIIGLMTTDAASLAASAAVIEGQLRAALPAVDWQGFVMTNHSGLDPAARATPDQLLAILTLAEARHPMISLLPAAGWSGSLQSRLRAPDTVLRVWAKTGSLDFASSLVGYVLPIDGGPRRIAVLITDEAGRQARDAVEVPDPALRRSIDDFTNRARELRDDLIRWAMMLPD